MKLIIGLGNPEARYTGTRHNVGFDVIDRLAAQFQAVFSSGKGKFHWTKINWRNTPIILLKPMTYMNLSGHAVIAAMNFWKIPRQDILAVCDDLNLPSGSLRLRAKGSAGGQNGLKHIIECLGSDEFARLRVGIRLDEQLPGPFSSFVLGKFSEEEKKTMEKILPLCSDAALDFAVNGIEHAMNRYNKSAV
ncbi:MAG: aminoacyl-tRNA hydrolase [Chlorobiaceae bacterium]|jgi:PTH1 family peptidyl-tRNA hydrolase|nr:aminoacyl-tRNA hydrolase [Chlorobiaceae bacterium]